MNSREIITDNVERLKREYLEESDRSDPRGMHPFSVWAVNKVLLDALATREFLRGLGTQATHRYDMLLVNVHGMIAQVSDLTTILSPSLVLDDNLETTFRLVPKSAA